MHCHAKTSFVLNLVIVRKGENDLLRLTDIEKPRVRGNDEDDFHGRGSDVAALANNLSQVFSYKMYGNKDDEDDHGTLDRDDEDVSMKNLLK